MTDEKTEQEQQSTILIEFARPGDAEPQRIDCRAVSPGQLHAAARRLQLMADRHIEQMWTQAEMRAAREMAEMAQMQQVLKVSKAD
jgi:hypothetical protein